MVGVSVVVCTYNGASRLPKTLHALAKQELQQPFPWEIIVVDNASSDDTFAESARLAGQYPFPPMRVYQEPAPGKVNALHRGIVNARYDFVIICDDDNLLRNDYVWEAFTRMNANPQLGILGGQGLAVTDIPLPAWFAAYQSAYAVGAPFAVDTDVTDTSGAVWGAGMVLRKKAYQELMDLGFEPLLTGGIGSRRGSGEDTELCLALRLLGYRIWFTPALVFHHYLPTSRLQWSKLIELTRSNGAASVFYNPYRYYFARLQGQQKSIRTNWLAELLVNLKFVVNFRTWLSYFRPEKEGNPAVVRIERQLSKLRALVITRGQYDESFRKVGRLVEKKTP